MNDLIRIGMDTSKSVFVLHGVNAAEQPILCKKLRRRQVMEYLGKLPPMRIGIEACGAAHNWGRALTALGHEVCLLAPQHVRGIDFSKQITLLEQATDIVLELVKSLRSGKNLEKVKDLNDKLQFLEGEADKHMVVLYKDLYGGKHEPVQVIVLKDLYELLEKVIDRCRDAGNVISHVVLKNA